jgi:hypothetical protein
MEKIIYKFFLLAVATTLLTSCGTIMGKMSKVALVDAPRNLEAKADGERLDIKNDLTVSTLSVGTNGDTYRDYYSPTVKLNKHKTVTLDLSSGNKTGTAELKPKFSGAYFLGNMFVTGLVLGTAIDVATHNHRKHIRYVDVPAVLAGKSQSEWRSKGQLKRAIKRKAK